MEIVLPSADVADALSHPLVTGLLDSVSDGVLVIHATERHILAMNAVARELLGYAPNEPLGCQCKKMMNSPACTWSCPLTALLQGRHDEGELDLYYRGRDEQQVLHAHTRMLLLRGPEGEPLAGIELFRDLSEVQRLKRELRERREIQGIVGQTTAMQDLFELVEQVAPYDIPVLLTGESGVGKERFADAIWALSSRADAPLIRVNCAALAPSLIESELFGHRRGAFTGATQDRSGRFEEADGGTLLLDEVGELPASVQAKLLRVLQEGEVQRVGEDRPRHVDVRILAATNRQLDRAVDTGHFRSDLYYRLAGVHVHIPPLRERREDIVPLAVHLLERFRIDEERRGRKARGWRLSAAAERVLLLHDWPGNVRQLDNRLRLAAIRARGTVIRPEHLETPAGPPSSERATLDLGTLERRAIEQALDKTDGNLTRAAGLLGIDRSTLWRKLKRARG